MSMYERAKAYLSRMIAHSLMLNDPNISEYHIDPGAPIKSSGKGANKIRMGVDRASNYGHRGNARKNPIAAPCANGLGDEVSDCCAYHLKQWRKLNPGNGRYVNETWTERPYDELIQELGRDTTQRIFRMNPNFGNYMVKVNEAMQEFTLYKLDRVLNSWTAMCIKDCLIDAQRAASRHLRFAQQGVIG